MTSESASACSRFLAVVQLDRARGGIQRALDAATGVLALWSAVASIVDTGRTLTRLSLAVGIGFVALGIIGLVAHELRTERIVHQFEAVPADARDGRRAEDFQAAA